ncbi:PaaI family thioesterase [Marinivivus vitaminiproducens]|uniref:PaaI family thioesterase n=1 Tax=Marinivivus vitaminiproducens TaxID=3035935 RepID=UPI0027A4759B|nr:PaaI family thioesterase [Geminicoccaceae bacterium SCSIO 64248]
MTAAITADDFQRLALDGVPFVRQLGCTLERLEAGRVDVRLPYRDVLLRPGGTISGPAMMAVADVTLYAVVLSLIGAVPLAVTTDMTCHFLRRARPGDLIAQGRILKLGRTLAIGEVSLVPDGDLEADSVCHVVGTYAIPPAHKREG